MQKYADANFPHPPEAADNVLHCHLKKGDFQIMLADSADKPSENNKHGVALLINCENVEEANHLYNGLREEGEILMELQDTFWGAKYGKVKDKFGFTWDLNCEKKDKKGRLLVEGVFLLLPVQFSPICEQVKHTQCIKENNNDCDRGQIF